MHKHLSVGQLNRRCRGRNRSTSAHASRGSARHATRLDPLVALLIVSPLFFLVGVGMQWVLEKFRITPFNSLLVTFGLTVMIESGIQGIWTADYRRLESHYNQLKFTVGGLYVPVPELVP